VLLCVVDDVWLLDEHAASTTSARATKSQNGLTGIRILSPRWIE
jgi:hypothetical protein